jgi:hypothetical protein
MSTGPSLPKDVPTSILWFHSEFDSTDATLTPEKWMSGVNFDAQQVRSALGQNATYLFVDPFLTVLVKILATKP